jgi:hypothetical protein
MAMNPIGLALLALCPSQTVLGDPSAMDQALSEFSKLSRELPLTPRDVVLLAPTAQPESEPGSPALPGLPTPEDLLAAERQQRDEEDAAFYWDLAIAGACGALVALVLGLLAIGASPRFRPAGERR